MHGDLDAILLKALAKSPQLRYASAAELAADLGRYLAGEPVTAVPPTGWYTARKFVSRHRAAVAGAAVLLVAIAAGLAGTLWQTRVARQEHLSAERRFNEARKLANYVLFDLYDSVANVPGTLPVRAAMARQGLLYLDQLAAARSSDPQLRLELAQGYLRLGSILGQSPDSLDSLGDNRGAIATDRKALALLEPLAAESPHHLETERALALAIGQLGFSMALTGDYKESLDRLRDSAARFERIAVTHPADLRSLQEAGQAWRWYGLQLSEKGGYVAMDPGESRKYLDKSAEELESALKLDPSNPRTIWLLTNTRETLARSLATANPRAGIQAYQAAFALFDSLSPPDRGAARAERLQAQMLTNRGWCHGQLGELQPALADLKEATAILDRVSLADPHNAYGDYLRMAAYRSLGIVEGYAGHKPQSLAALRTATAILDDLVRTDPASRNYAVLRAEMEGRVATLPVGRPSNSRGPHLRPTEYRLSQSAGRRPRCNGATTDGGCTQHRGMAHRIDE